MMTSLTGRPSTSARVRPNIASAAGLNSTMRPSASVETSAASAWSTIADFSASLSCSCSTLLGQLGFALLQTR